MDFKGGKRGQLQVRGPSHAETLTFSLAIIAMYERYSILAILAKHVYYLNTNEKVKSGGSFSFDEVVLFVPWLGVRLADGM